jgi:hypothetical protein
MSEIDAREVPGVFNLWSSPRCIKPQPGLEPSKGLVLAIEAGGLRAQKVAGLNPIDNAGRAIGADGSLEAQSGPCASALRRFSRSVQ